MQDEPSPHDEATELGGYALVCPLMDQREPGGRARDWRRGRGRERAREPKARRPRASLPGLRARDLHRYLSDPARRQRVTSLAASSKSMRVVSKRLYGSPSNRVRGARHDAHMRAYRLHHLPRDLIAAHTHRDKPATGWL